MHTVLKEAMVMFFSFKHKACLNTFRCVQYTLESVDTATNVYIMACLNHLHWEVQKRKALFRNIRLTGHL